MSEHTSSSTTSVGTTTAAATGSVSGGSSDGTGGVGVVSVALATAAAAESPEELAGVANFALWAASRAQRVCFEALDSRHLVLLVSFIPFL